MDAKECFEGKDLPIVGAHVGMISIDTIERLWDVIFCEGDVMVVVYREDKMNAILGRMVIRDYDHKFCLAFELKVSIDPQYGLCEIEKWHVRPTEYDDRVHILNMALRDAGLIK